MKQIAIRVITIFALAALVSGCRPPEVEGTVINMHKEVYADALTSAEQAIQKYPDNAEAWFYYGYLMGNYKNDYAKMNEAFDKALALNPAQVVTPQASASYSIESGVSQYRGNLFAENFNSGIKRLNSAQGEEDATKKSQLLNETIAKMQIAIAAAPTRFETYQPLAIAYLMNGDTAKVAATLDEGLAKVSDPEGQRELVSKAGSMYLQIRQVDKAEMLFKKSLEMNPEDGLSLQLMGNLEANRKNWELANDYYSKAIKLNPDDADLAYNIGVGYYSQQRYVEAIPFFSKALESGEGEEQTYKILGVCYVQAEQIDEGAAFLESAVQRYPDNGDLWEFLAVIYGKSGQKDKANAAFARSQELNGDN